MTTDTPAPSAAPARLCARPGAHGERGVLLVLEGIDGSGRSTHVRRLEDDLRYAGLGVTRTSLGTSILAAAPIRASRAGRSDPHVTALLDAADLAERADLVIRPALRAGLVVLADRYAPTPIARAVARGVDQAWLEDVFGSVPVPDAVLYLDVEPADALARRTRQLDAWEAGMDLGLARDVRESYLLFGARLAAAFEANAARWGMTTVDADGPVDAVAARIRAAAEAVLEARAGTQGSVS